MSDKAVATVTRMDGAEITAEGLNEYEQFLEDFGDVETKDLNLVRDGDPEVATGIWDAEMRAFIDSMSLKTMFFTEDWVFIAVDRIVSKLSNLPLRIYKKVTGKSGKSRKELVENHPLIKLFEKPNLYQGMTSFNYTSLVDQIVLGNTIIWYSEATNQLIGIPAELVRLDFDRNGFLSRYVVQQWWGSETNVPWKAGLTFDSAQIIHVRRPNPSSLLWGMSPLIPGRKSILFNRYSSEFLVNFYLKGATPQMSLSMDKDANEKNALRLLRSFEQAYTGRKNQRRTLVLPKGVKADSLTQTLADQDLKEYVKINWATIINILGVPKHEVGLEEHGSLGSNEKEASLKNFWTATLKPTGSLYTDALTNKFRDQLGPDCFIDFDYSDVEILRDDQDKKADLAIKMLKTHTINEVRQKLYEDPPLAGGDATPPTGGGTGVGAGSGQQMVFGHPVGEPRQDGAMPAGGQPTPWATFAQSQVGNGALGPPSPYQDPRTPTGGGPGVDPRQQTLDANETIKHPVDNHINIARKAAATEMKTGHDGWFEKRQSKVKHGTAQKIDVMHRLALNHFVDTAHASVKVAKRFLTAKNYQPMRTKGAEAPAKRVATVAVVHGDHLLMGKRRDNGKWTIPGGHTNDGEALHDAAKRELMEESGISGVKVTPISDPVTLPATDDKPELTIQPFKADLSHLHDRPPTSMQEDPDSEVERWGWVDVSKGLPPEIVNDLHVPHERNVLMAAMNLNPKEKSLRLKADDGKPKSQVIQKAELRKALKKAYTEFEEKWVGDQVKILEGTTQLGYDVQLDVPFKLPMRNEIEALKAEGEDQLRATLEDRAIQTFSQMSDTTTEKVMSVIDDGVAGGKTVQEIAEDIADKFRDIENIDSRAMLIAKQETMTALSMGQAAATEDAMSVIGGLKSMWVSTQDDRTRGPSSKYGYKSGEPDHESMDGEVVDAGEKFSNGLHYPRDPKGEAGEVMGCRCTSILMPPKEGEET